MSGYFSEVKRLVWIVEGGELSQAAVQVDKARAKCWQETKIVVNCNDTTDSFKRGLERLMIKKNEEKIDWLID